MKIKVLVREETSLWCDELLKRVGKMFGVYLYDPSTVTHCCELTPSYALEFVGSHPLVIPDDDDGRERLWDEIMEGDSQCEPCSYFHCGDIDRMPTIKRGELKSGTYELPQEWDDMEEAREWWQGNPDY